MHDARNTVQTISVAASSGSVDVTTARPTRVRRAAARPAGVPERRLFPCCALAGYSPLEIRERALRSYEGYEWHR